MTLAGVFPFLSPQLALTLTSLADSFEHFHTSGLEHYKAAIQLVQGLQEIAAQCDGNTVAVPLQQVEDGMVPTSVCRKLVSKSGCMEDKHAAWVTLGFALG